MGLHKCCGKKNIGSYYGDFGKWSKRVFRVSFWWNSDFLADFFPKVYCVLTISLIIFAVIKILVAVSCSCMPCTRRNLKYCEIIFHFWTFSSFIILSIINHSFLQFHKKKSLFFCVKRRVFGLFLVINEVSCAVSKNSHQFHAVSKNCH